MNKSKTITIVGLGCFGKILYQLLKNDFKVFLYDINPQAYTSIALNQKTQILHQEKKIYQSNTIFYCVPIAKFKNIIASHQKYFQENHLLVDVLSVKRYPKRIFNKYLKNKKTQALLTHPMFGPDSVAEQGFKNQPMVINKFRTNQKNYLFWKNYFISKGIKIITLKPNEHDRMAAFSQDVTHFLGRVLDNFNFEKTAIDTLGTKRLHQVKEQTCHDSWQLFLDLQTKNPYTKKMLVKLEKSFNQVKLAISKSSPANQKKCLSSRGR